MDTILCHLFVMNDKKAYKSRLKYNSKYDPNKILPQNKKPKKPKFCTFEVFRFFLTNQGFFKAVFQPWVYVRCKMCRWIGIWTGSTVLTVVLLAGARLLLLICVNRTAV